MAEPYLEQLTQIVDRLDPASLKGVTLETKHFFSGAALYADGKICASLGPVGFALKLPTKLRRSLIEWGIATEFRFFESGPVKREYVALSEAMVGNGEQLRKLIDISASYVTDIANSNA